MCPLGDRIVVVVKKTRGLGAEGASSAAIANRVKKGDIRQAVVVRTRQNIQRPDGSVIKFGDNACVLINKSGDPIGTRVTGQCARNLPNVMIRPNLTNKALQGSWGKNYGLGTGQKSCL